MLVLGTRRLGFFGIFRRISSVEWEVACLPYLPKVASMEGYRDLVLGSDITNANSV